MATSVVCAIEECGKPVKARDLCSMHYARWQKENTDYGPCLEDGCENRAANHRGMCNSHYLKARRQGVKMPGAPLRRRNGEALVWLESNYKPGHNECVIWPFLLNRGGYGVVRKDGRYAEAHRISCTMAHGPAPSDIHEAAHSCGKRPCINEAHLRWATPTENMADAIAHGTTLRGERHPQATITEEQALAIYKLKGTMGERRAAKKFGVARHIVTCIWRGRAWAWLTGA